MATFGLGNYKYDVVIDNGSKFHFYDPEDASNTADVTVAQKDYPEGVKDGDARQIADQAFLLVSKQLDDKRDQRVKRETMEQLDEQIDRDRAGREATAEFLSKAKEISDTDSILTDGETPAESDQSDGKKKA